MKRQSALTLIEILVVIAIIALISLPLYLSYTRTQANQSLRASSEQLADALRRAHVFSRETRNSRAWGVKDTGSTTYALVSGNSSNNIVENNYTLEPLVDFPSSFSVWFVAGTGDAETSQEVKIKNTYGIERTIKVYKSGTVEVAGQ